MEKAKKIVISGASGFIGTHLTTFFTEKGYQVEGLSRQHFQPSAAAQLAGILAGCDVVINLAGASIVKRWSRSYKKELIESRIRPTKALTNAMLSNTEKPSLFISASAVGHYPSEGCFDEHTSRKGEGFLAEVCDLWESEGLRASGTVRTVITRLGIVLAEKGGAFSKLTLPARMGIGTYFSPGSQSFSWISLTDLLRAMEFLIHQSDLEGIVNFVSPQLVTNKEFCRWVARHYGAHFLFRVPGSLLKWVMGEAAVNLIQGQCVRPARLTETGFTFTTPDLQDFLYTLRK